MIKKILGQKKLASILARARAKGKRIVFTNGCFDIIHVGHVKYLASAKKLGDILVIGLNSDKSVRKIKGPSRPVNTEKDRAIVMAALGSVDFITTFGEDTPEKLIKILKPDVLVKGGDWKIKDIVGGDFVKANGGKVVSIPFVKGRSTSSVIDKIKRL
jgi:D-glycero-beta-D-manno-heptose 1-phosphate adenylyltransferase